MADLSSTRLLRKLESITTLPEEEKQAVVNLPMSAREIPADMDILREGDRPSQCCLVVEGFFCRYKMLPDGKRQMLSLHVPGDIPDLQSLYLQVMDHSLGTLVPSRAAFISHETLRQLNRAYPRLADAFWRDTLVDAAIFREWIVNVGSREAYGRLAHLICEVFLKLPRSVWHRDKVSPCRSHRPSSATHSAFRQCTSTAA